MTAHNAHTTPNAMSDPLNLCRLTELRFLPSRILHRRRYAQFDPDGLWRALLDASTDPAAVHRHWSQSVLQTLGMNHEAPLMIKETAHVVALLPTAQFESLGTWLGTQLCGAALRTIIQKNELAQLLSLPHGRVIEEVRRKPAGIFYRPASSWNVSQIITNHQDLGNTALLHACCEPDTLSHGLLSLKLPETQCWPDLPDPGILLHGCRKLLNGGTMPDVYSPA